MKIELQEATKKFKSLRALDSVSMTIEPGQVLALIGLNGAGKNAGLDVLRAGFNRGRFDLVPVTKSASGFPQ